MIITYMPSGFITYAEPEADQPAATEEVVKDEPVKEETPAKVETPAEETQPEVVEETPAEESSAEVEETQETPAPETPAVDEASESTAPSENAETPAPEDEEPVYTDRDFDPVTVENVTVTARGSFPAGAEMKVISTSADGYADAIAAAVDGDVQDTTAVEVAFTEEAQGDITAAISVEDPAEELSYKVFQLNKDGSSVSEIANPSEFTMEEPYTYAVVGVAEKAAEEEATAEEGEEEPEQEEAPLRNLLKGLLGAGENSEDSNLITVTFDPTTDPDEVLEKTTIQVAPGEKIGDQLPAVPSIPGYTTKWVVKGSDEEVTANTKVTEPFEAVVGRDKIVYTVTFLDEKGEVLETKTADIDTGFAVNVLPDVPKKENYEGKWVYAGRMCRTRSQKYIRFRVQRSSWMNFAASHRS